MEKLNGCESVELDIIKNMVECLVEQLKKNYKQNTKD